MRPALQMLMVVVMLAVGATGCGGARMKWLTDERPAALAAHEPVDIYVGRIQPEPRRIAILETSASHYTDEQVRLQQLEELREKARRVGANAVEETQILTRQIRGFVIDERTPFFSWRQGRYPLYFIRGVAVVAPRGEPLNLDEIEPPEGWLVDQLPVPPRLGE